MALRHGQCKLNKAGQLNGQLDSGLAKEGKRQAKALRDSLRRLLEEEVTLPPLAVYTSPLSRASQTAEIVTSGLGLPPALELPALQERCLGQVQGMTYTQALAHVPDRHKIPTQHGVTYAQARKFGFETFKQVTRRAAGALDHMQRSHEGDGPIWLFTHGDLALALVAAHTGRPMEEIIHKLYLRNTEGVWLHPDGRYTQFVPTAHETSANTTGS